MTFQLLDEQILPCGCIIRRSIENDVRTLTVVPCNSTCVNYRNALDLAREQDKPVEYREGS